MINIIHQFDGYHYENGYQKFIFVMISDFDSGI